MIQLQCAWCEENDWSLNRVEQVSVTHGPGHRTLWTALLCEKCGEKLRVAATKRAEHEGLQPSGSGSAAAPASVGREWTEECERVWRLAMNLLRVLPLDETGKREVSEGQWAEALEIVHDAAPRFCTVRVPKRADTSDDDGNSFGSGYNAGRNRALSECAASLRSQGFAVEETK